MNESPRQAADIREAPPRGGSHPDGCIITRGLSRRFGDVLAVDRLDLVVPGGSFFGFLGPNGAGKSTTISLLCGLLAPTAGNATVLGYDLRTQATEIKRRIGVVPEQLALFERLTGWEYLLLVGRLYGVRKDALASRAEELLEFMELADVGRKLIIEYSHGMKKKLALSAALIHRPRILFLDEPFEGIDAISTRAVREVLQTLVQQGITIFLTSHVLEIVERLCDRVAIIHEGRLIASGTLGELHAGVELETGEHEKEKLNLEEIFLRLLGRTEPAKRSLSWLTREEA